jgi:thioredoxin-dependent peroxiredoxin
LRDDYERFRALGAEVLAVSAERPEASAAYLRSHPLPYPIAVDADHRVFDAYDVTSRMLSLGQRPGLFVIDAEGMVRFDSIGVQQWQIPPNEQVLEVLEGLRPNG